MGVFEKNSEFANRNLCNTQRRDANLYVSPTRHDMVMLLKFKVLKIDLASYENKPLTL